MAFVSPGAYWREIDYSDYVPALSTSVCGMVGPATWGPMDEATLITNEADLIRIFGVPLVDDLGLHSAIRYLRRGTQLRYCRIGSASASKATVTITDGEATPADSITFEAKYEGTYGNNIQVILSESPTTGNFNVIVVTAIDAEGTLGEVERFDDVNITDVTHARYIENVINEGTRDRLGSQYITADVIDNAIVPAIGMHALTTGDDGITTTALQDADYIGTSFGQRATGLQVFANADKVDINILAVPGNSSPAVVNAMITVAEVKRRDCIALVDCPFGLDVQGVADYHNGEGAYTHSAYNTSYGAIYYPWTQVYDPYTKCEIWTPPSGFVAESMAYTDYVADPWFAPAGMRRGRINALRTEYTPDQGQRDFLYSNQNCVNSIVEFPKDGIVIWGQRTLQRRPSSTDRVNVRRMLCQIEKQIATATKYLVFEPNDPITWKQFSNLVSPAMDWVKARRGVYDFRVICDETTNPPIAIDRNEMYGKILLKPTKTAEMVTVDFTLLSTGADFTEF